MMAVRQKEYPVKVKLKMPSVHPGLLLRETVIPSMGIPVSEFARRTGISRQLLHRILAGTQGITPETALRIGKLVGNGPGLWLGMQQEHDLWIATQEIEEELAEIECYRAA